MGTKRLIYSSIHLFTHSFSNNSFLCAQPVLVGIRDTAVIKTASESPEWQGLGSGSTRPRVEGGQGGNKGGFPEEVLVM